MSDYATPSYRKSKKEKKLKRRFRIYKRGGKYRSTNVEENQNKKN
jgi:hypothetical protein